MTGVISGHTCNFWQKCWGTSKIKWRLNHLFECFQQWRIQSCFSTIWTVQTLIKRSSKKIFIIKSLWERYFSLNASNIWYFGSLVFKRNCRFWCYKNIHSLTLRSGIPKKRLDAAFLIVWLGPHQEPYCILWYPRCKGNLLRCPIVSFLDCPWRQK